MGMGVIGKGGSWLPCLALLLLVIYPTITHARSKKVDVYVAGFFPVGKGLKSSLGRGVMPALKLAIKHVNDHPTVLRNYKLHVVWNDTQCNTAVGTKSFFDMMDRLPRKVMLFGAACTHVTDPIAKAAKHWHIVQLSYADTHPMFSASKYPNFFRMVPSDKDFNMPRIHLLQKFNWTRVGTLFQNEPRHALAHNHLASLLDLYKFEIAETQSFADEFKDQMKKLLDKDVRIILGYFDEMWARRIFCEAFRKGMYGANYQWIISGMYREEWWTLRGNGDDDDDEGVIDMKDEPEESGGGGCAVEDIMVALEGCIMTDLLPLATSQTKTVSGKNISEYRKAYNQKRQDEYSRFHGFTYDGVWAMALAIQAVGHKLHLQNRLNGTNTSVVDFMYRSPEWEERFTSALSEVKFDGVTGPVQFTMDNARKGYILLKQFQGGREVKIGEFDGIEDVLLLDKGHPIYWPGGDPPLDRTVKSIEKTSVNISIYAILVTTASLGIVMASIFLAINIKYRHQRYIKMSSPYLNNLIIVGCILTYTSVILLGLDSELTSEATFPYICTARAWVLMWGFSLAFGSMFSKTWRVHSIFTDVQLNKKVIKDSQLFLVVFVLLCVDVAIMTTWQIVDPFYRETKLLTAYMRDDILVIPENEYCKSSKISVFIGCIYAYKGLLMVFGCFLAWETRHVSIPALNDSKYIGFSVYNVVIMCVISAPISYVLSDKQDVCYLIISIFIIFCTTGTLCLVFVPKIIELRRNPQGTMERPKIRPSMKPPKSADSDSDVSDLHEQIKKAESDRQVFIRTLREREQELQMLIEQLGDEALAEVEGQDSRVGRRPSKPRSIERIRIEGGPRTGPSVTETTEATELTSLCSGTSQDAEYVPGRMRVPCVSSSLSTTTTTTSTTTTHHHHLHYHHLPASGVATATLSLDRRGVTFASPLQTPREASKSVSFRLEGGGAGPGGIVTSTAPVGPGGGGGVGGGLIGHTATVETVPQSHMNTQPPLPQPEPMPEKENVPFTGYGGVYVHDYGGTMMQKEQNLMQQRRASRTSLQGMRRYSRGEIDVGPPLEDAPPPPNMTEYMVMPPGEPPDCRVSAKSSSVSGGEVCPYRRTSLRHTGSEKYSQVPRNLYTPLNNEESGEKIPLLIGKRNSDIKIINNKANYQTLSEKNSNALANISAGYNISGEAPPPAGFQLLQQHPPHHQQQAAYAAALRRASEPPKPPGRGSFHAHNRSCDNLACTCCDGLPPAQDILQDPLSCTSDAATDSDVDARDLSIGGRGRWDSGDEREGTRTISRARLRRDSFGEVVSRRSPSQESLEHVRVSSPTIHLDDPTPPPPSTHDLLEGRLSPGQDSYPYTHLSRRSGSQDSLDQHESSRGRVASQESLGTMSSRGSVSGSIYSVTSARSDAAVSRCSSKETVRNHAPLIQQNRSSGHHHSYHMNGEMMSETTASSDDLAHPQNTLVYREQTSLHRTISEPYYNFDDDESESAGQQHLQMLQQHVQQQQQLLQQQQQQFRSGRARLPPVRTPSYDNSYDTSSLGEFSTQSLRGRSHSIGRPSRGATTTSVAAAIAAARKNASDNALDHDTSILPIFQKLLRERHQGYHGGRDFTMSSCPNITIKCDIVEYL
ncbi:uncharacterized protein GABA-B-R2 isoform X2 [Macrobrachium rosenbergii]|uniref:uncharacterized protein GABA-B-R2 isoform X2 n=1 Tax=Macrobrachium rosenbergii TaxID=79674 RepID=UPI0034D52A05